MGHHPVTVLSIYNMDRANPPERLGTTSSNRSTPSPSNRDLVEAPDISFGGPSALAEILLRRALEKFQVCSASGEFRNC